MAEPDINIFPDHWGKLKYLLLKSTQHAVYGHPLEEHQTFYQYVLWLKYGFKIEEPEHPDMVDLQDALDTYLLWYAKTDSPMFVTVRDEEKWADEGMLEVERNWLPMDTPIWIDDEKARAMALFGQAPLRYISGRVCFKDLIGEMVRADIEVIHHVAGFPARVYRCTHPDQNHVTMCNADCTSCEYLSKDWVERRIERLPASLYLSLRSKALNQLDNAKPRIEHYTWDYVHAQGDQGYEFNIPEYVDPAEEETG